MPDSLRIAFTTTEYVTEKYFGGGLANYLHRVAKALVSLGHEVHIFTLSEIDQAEFIHQGVQVHRIRPVTGRVNRWLNKLTQHRIANTIDCLNFSFQAYRKLIQFHQQQPLDIVQFPDWNASGLVSSIFLPVPHTIRTSGYRPVWIEKAELQCGLDERAIQWLEWLQMRLNRHIYAPSYTVRQLLLQQAKITNVQVIRTPFFFEVSDWDSSVFNTLKSKEYLLFFGRFQLHKGFHILAQALPQVLEKHPDCHAIFVGLDSSTSLASSMKEYAYSHCKQYADRLTFINQLPHSQLYPVIAGAKLIVLPSLIDNLPNACLEAMALGKPVIGTIGASFEELIVDGETGFLVPADNVQALASKINEAWIYPSLSELGEAAKHKIQEFSIERILPEVLAYYKEIVDCSKSTKAAVKYE
ncbi:MAG: glycosyltransferase family 4 protein [Hassallia sp. WJT32-NPBG1]|jgi:glycosyltransferase involved in cell wall biosynthesis|nr:glycosyltransferase family 4 protein [Hassallia sp. WJT32-NPBG1]